MTDSRVSIPPDFVFRKAELGDVASLVELRLAFMRIVKDGGLPDEDAWRSELSALFERDLGSGALVAWICLDGGRVVAASGIAFGASGESASDRPTDGRPEAGVARHGASAGRKAAGTRRGRRAEALILNMFTLPEYRRRGLASELLGRCIAEARARGLRRLMLQPTDDGRALYERFGFRPSGGDMSLDLE
jgi:GNAT superfamily N-acetyltransferase